METLKAEQPQFIDRMNRRIPSMMNQKENLTQMLEQKRKEINNLLEKKVPLGDMRVQRISLQMDELMNQMWGAKRKN